jgi:preprotein translocase subunit YajC
MDIPENNHKKITLAIIAIVIVALVLFVIVWKNKTKKESQTQTQTQKETTGIAGPDGKTLPAPPEMPKIQAPAEVTSISGTVEKIEGKTITVKANFFGEQKTFAVTAGDATKIQKSEMKKDIPKPEEGKPFEPFTLTDASFSDIRQNDNLTIEASENIKDKTSFVAKTISINIMNLPAVSAPSNVSAPPEMPNFPDMKDLPAPPKMENLPAPPAMPKI